MFLHDFTVDGKVVSWSQIKQLYDIESKQKIVATRLAPKLTKKHVELPPFSKMKVKTATNVFSNTVQAAILTRVCAKEMSESSIPTAKFIKFMDTLFDVFNSSHQYESKPFRCALKESSASLQYLDIASEMLSKITVKDLKVQPPCIDGWKLSISTVKQLWNDLQCVDVTYLCTRKLQQDPLENLFSVIRAKGAFSVNPNFKKFIGAYKHVVIKNCMDQSVCSNCEIDLNEILLDSLSPQNCSQSANVGSLECMDLVTEDDENSLNPNDFVKSNAVFYIAGHTFGKYLKQHSCDSCSTLFLDSNAKFSNPTEMFTYLKSYDNSSKDFGGLFVPTARAVTVISHLELIFSSHFENTMYASNVCSKLVTAAMKSLDVSYIQDDSCRESIRLLVSLHMRMRIHYAVKFFNFSLKELPRNKQNRKALILQHL